MGLRPFQAHLLIALVQESVRNGEMPDPSIAATITEGAAIRSEERRGVWKRLVAALAIAGVIFGLLVTWLLW